MLCETGLEKNPFSSAMGLVDPLRSAITQVVFLDKTLVQVATLSATPPPRRGNEEAA
jgi:hypothetical protein